MKKLIFVAAVMLCFAMLATPAFAATLVSTTTDTHYTSTVGGVFCQGYARTRAYDLPHMADGYIQSMSYDAYMHNISVYYLGCSGTLYTRYITSTGTTTKASPFSSSAYNYYLAKASVSYTPPTTIGIDAYTECTHSYKRYSTSTTVYCYTQTPSAYAN